MSLKVADCLNKACLVFIVGRNGSLFSGSSVSVLRLGLLAEVGEEGLDFLQKGFVSLKVLGGELGEGGHHTGQKVNLPDLDCGFE